MYNQNTNTNKNCLAFKLGWIRSMRTLYRSIKNYLKHFWTSLNSFHNHIQFLLIFKIVNNSFSEIYGIDRYICIIRKPQNSRMKSAEISNNLPRNGKCKHCSWTLYDILVECDHNESQWTKNVMLLNLKKEQQNWSSQKKTFTSKAAGLLKKCLPITNINQPKLSEFL